jgi:hypothetical protein
LREVDWDADGYRFIPTRDGTDLHAAYQLLSDNAQDERNEGTIKPKNRRKSAYGQGTDIEARRGAFDRCAIRTAITVEMLIREQRK